MGMDEIIQLEKDAIEPSAPMTCSARLEKEKGIYRHDYSNTHGYRAYIKFKGKEYQKIFSDKGDPEEALEKARHWRKLTVEIHGEAESFRLACRERAQAEQRLYGEVVQPVLQGYV
jgi:hypothetical protein